MSKLSATALFFCALTFSGIALAATADTAAPVPGIAMHGETKYKPGFQHFDYVNPDAPKGGTLHLAEEGTFDSLNPYVIKGTSAPGLSGLVYQTLMTGSEDEAFSEYGLIAETIETPPDRSWVAFNLRKEARWEDGQPITAQDVVWTFNTLMTKGHPYWRSYYAGVKSVTAESATRVKFTFKDAVNHELPLIVGQMPILPEHFWKDKDFEKSTTDMPLGSGPYKVKSVDFGHRIAYERVQNWWAKDLPVNKGKYNFDTIIYDVYRDETVLVQALFAGEYDLRNENIAKSWYTEYDQQPPVKNGWIKKDEIHHSLPAGMQAFVLNMRRPLFQDARVREALGYAFDFEWSNKQFAYGSYKRSDSFFSNSELASSGVPSGRELEILKKFKGQVPDDLFTKPFTLPKTSGSGVDMRDNLIMAKKLLEQAGWKPGPDGVLTKDGQPFKFEILEYQQAFDRWISPMILNLKKLGIQANLRLVDPSQYQKRLEDFDFDVTVSVFDQGLSPGNEQRDFWSSDKADIKGSHNLIGIKNPVVDQLVDMIIAAPDRQELIARTRALDRVLLWNHYVIPQWHLDYARVAYWDKFGKPAVSPIYGPADTSTWWVDPAKQAAVASHMKPEAK
jgi:microcin C transport system substrate-binding protein